MDSVRPVEQSTPQRTATNAALQTLSEDELEEVLAVQRRMREMCFQLESTATDNAEFAQISKEVENFITIVNTQAGISSHGHQSSKLFKGERDQTGTKHIKISKDEYNYTDESIPEKYAKSSMAPITKVSSALNPKAKEFIPGAAAVSNKLADLVEHNVSAQMENLAINVDQVARRAREQPEKLVEYGIGRQLVLAQGWIEGQTLGPLNLQGEGPIEPIQIKYLPERAGLGWDSSFSSSGITTSAAKANGSARKPVSPYGIGYKLLCGQGWISGNGLGRQGNGQIRPLAIKRMPERAGLGWDPSMEALSLPSAVKITPFIGGPCPRSQTIYKGHDAIFVIAKRLKKSTLFSSSSNSQQETQEELDNHNSQQLTQDFLEIQTEQDSSSIDKKQSKAIRDKERKKEVHRFVTKQFEMAARFLGSQSNE